MKKGISFYFGYNVEPNLRAKFIKDAGFDCVITSADKRFNKQNGSINAQMKNFKKNNLSPSSLHAAYTDENIHHFCSDNKIGKQLEKSILKDVKIAKKFNFKCLVLHLYADEFGEFNEIGIARFKRILEQCEKYNIPVAVENIDDPIAFRKVFELFSDNNYLKFCLDVGHKHCFEPETDFIKQYGNKLICLHLHSNMGDADTHTLNKYGNVNWNKVARDLSKLNTDNLNLDYELIIRNKVEENAEECLKVCFAQAVELEEKILSYKNKKNKKQ